MVKTISSRQNPLVKRVRDAMRQHRDEIVLEGPKQVADALASGWTPLIKVVRKSANAADASASEPNDPRTPFDTVVVTEDVFDAIAATRAAQGVLAIFERPVTQATDILARSESVTIALDSVQDPGNVGTIVRLAAAFDASGVLLLPGCADAFGPKAIRSSAGAILNVPVAAIGTRALIETRVPLVAADMSGVSSDPPIRGAVLVFGNEGTGVSDEILRYATPIAVAMSARVESLNVASSAAILLARSYALRASQ